MLASIVAITYGQGDEIDVVMRAIAMHLNDCGWKLAGLIQLKQERTDGTRCDMILQDLSSGERIAISERRGRHARGCMLDMQELTRGAALVGSALMQHPDLLIVNKFGKAEASGGGLRAVLAQAIECGIPVLTAVPVANLAAWRAFNDGLATCYDISDLPTDAAALCTKLGFRDRTEAQALQTDPCAEAAA